MACGQLTASAEQHLVATTTDTLYAWFTGWLPAIGIDEVNAVLKNKAKAGNIQTRLACQTAEIRTDNPGDPVLLDTAWLTGNGERCTNVLDISATTGPKFYVRFGVAYNLTTGTTPGQADVSLQVSFNACGKIVGSRSMELVTPGTTDDHVPVTDWIPAIAGDKVKAVIIVTTSAGNFQSRIAYQLATTTKEAPSAWSSTLGSWSSGDGEVNTGELTISPAAAMWMRFGVQHSLSSGSDGGADVTAVVAVRKS